MILMFGPAGAGKSLQGQFIALRHNWTWLSAGQVLRDAHNPEIDKLMRTGALLPEDMVNHVVLRKLDEQFDLDQLILDGYPRSLGQAKALSEYSRKRFGHDCVDLIIALDVSEREILKRLALRGRMDDSEAVVKHRLSVYHDQTQPLLDYFAERKVPVVVVDGNGKPGETFDRIEEVLLEHDINGANK